MADPVVDTTKPAVVKVAGEDGVEREFVGKRKLLKDSEVIDGKSVTTMAFRNGRVLKFTPPDSLVTQFVGHGVEQKLGDETAGVEDIDDMVLGVEELIARLSTGEWSTKREGSGISGTSVLLRALVQKSGKTVDQVKEWLKGKSQAEKMALRNAPEIKPLVDALEAEKAAKTANIDTAALLGQLG